MPVELALFRPLIPQNTGNIGRLCVGFNVFLNLIGPLGFKINDKRIKRAGLDYWQHLNYKFYADFESFYLNKKDKRIICISKYGENLLCDFSFSKTDILLMGQETEGVPKGLIKNYGLKRVAIPMEGLIRSYNLANASAIILYESWRQLKKLK